MYDQLKTRIQDRTAYVAVIGLGYVGLPLLTEFSKAGFPCIGYDVDKEKVLSIKAGVSPVDYPNDLELKTELDRGMRVSPYQGALLGADIVIICVPTPLNKTKEPDLSYVSQAVFCIADHQTDGQLIILESTTYPGTTREVVVPGLISPNLRVGEEVFVGYSPERIDPGNPTHKLTNTPKIVSGITDKCLDLVDTLYSSICKTVPVSSPEVAEMAKVLENTFRAVNIGLANEVALMGKKLGIDPFEVIDAAATKPFGYMPFYPGPGLGGHCIPVDPLYLSWKLKALQTQARFIDLADNINSGMPDHVVSIVVEALNNECLAVRDSAVLIVGVSYKPNVPDMRESPILPLIQKLNAMGAIVRYQDPLVPEVHEFGLKSTDVDSYANYDVVVIATPHQEVDLSRILAEARCIVDTRGVFRDEQGRPLKDPKIYRI